MKFYHGTSSLAEIENMILPPDAHTFGINEPRRSKHAQKVFFTTYKGYAERYARTACGRVGGLPVVYEVLAVNPKLMTSVKGCDVWYATEAVVYEKLHVKVFSKVKSKKLKRNP